MDWVTECAAADCSRFRFAVQVQIGGAQPMSLRPSFQLLRDFQSHPGCRLKFAPRPCPGQKPGPVLFAGQESSGPGASAGAPLRAKPFLQRREKERAFQAEQGNVSRTGKLNLERLRVRQTTMLAFTDADYM